VERVRSVARRPLAIDHPKLVHTVADLREDTARQALAGADVLFHLAFALWRHPDASPANMEATRSVIAARPRRIVLASSAAVYGAWPDNPQPLTEDHWPRPNRECEYAGDKLRTERLFASAAPTLSLRIAAVLGPHADARVARAVQGYRLGVPAFRGEKEALQFLDEDDAARALQLGGSSAVTGVVNIAPADWLDATGVAAVARSRVVRLPSSVLLGMSEAAYRLHLTPFGADRAILVRGPLALDSGRSSELLGWSARWSSAQVLGRQLRVG
jgi:nucleoside-diphosphate-sugar epimerase